MDARKWCIGTLAVTMVLLVLLGGLTVAIDPFFHYHAPLEKLEYEIRNQRYQNDGIVKNFEYDALITGTSMTENIKASDVETAFDVDAVKVPFSGASYKEIDSTVRRAINTNPDIKMVIRALDGYMLLRDKDRIRTDSVYPDYLYDSYLYNDVKYVLNRQILLEYTLEVLLYTAEGNATTNFDEYSSWQDLVEFGPDSVLKKYNWNGAVQKTNPMTMEEAVMVRENVLQNVVQTARENPDITFYYYYPPYSVRYWQIRYAAGEVEKYIDAYRIATEEILKCENIKLYSFTADYEIIEDLNHYKDQEHHTADINSRIIYAMSRGENLLTAENWQRHWDELQEYLGAFDYAGHFEKYGYPLTEQ